jgi:hypothetical protein
MSESNNKLTKTWDETEGTTVTFKMGDTVLQVDVASLPDNIQKALMLHGAAQKVGDAAAGKSGAEAIGAMQKVIDQLNAGQWTRSREGGGPRVTLFVRTVARIYGAELTDDFIAKVDALPDATKAEIRATPQYKKANAEIKLEDSQRALEEASQGTAAILPSI